MKKIILILFTLILFQNIAFSKDSNWDWQNPKFHANSYNDSYFVNDKIGYACGNYGLITKTEDSGKKWGLLYTGRTNSYNTIWCLNENEIVTAGSNGIVLKSYDGGVNWISKFKETTFQWNQIFFINNKIGWVAGEFNVIKTTDGGESWFELYQYPNNITSIYFVDENIGYLVGSSSLIQKTTDGGKNWESQKSPVFTDYNKVKFVDKNIGYAVGTYSVIIKTEDGGLTWLIQNGVAHKNSGFKDIEILSKDKLFFVGMEGGYDNITSTVDGGITFTTTNLPPFLFLKSINFFDENIGYAFGAYGAIYKTENGGKNWTNANNTFINNLTNIQFINDEIGFSAGYTSFFKTVNGGLDWIEKSIPEDTYICSINFLNENIGFAACYMGKIIFTKDGGESWNEQMSNTKANLNSIFVLDENNVFAGTDSGVLLMTSNGGVEWDTLAQLPPNSINCIKKTDNNNLFAFCYPNLYHYSMTSKQIQKLGNCGFEINDAFFFDKNNFYAVGKKGQIATSNDGGQTWIQQIQFTYTDITSVYFVDKNHGWLCHNKLSYTTDGGKNWIEQNSGTGSGVSDIYFTNSLRGYICGGGGAILSLNPDVPLLLKPNNLTIINTDEVKLKWDNYFGNGKYKLQISQDKNFKNNIEDRILDSKDFTFTLNSQIKNYYWRVAVDNENSEWSSVWSFANTYEGTSVSNNDVKKSNIKILRNPVDSELAFEFVINNDSEILFSIYDINGKLVNKLNSKSYKSGINAELIEVKDLISGIYSVNAEIDGFIISEKFIIVR